MPEIEPTDFCRAQEYRAYLERRKQAVELYLGELYMTMGMLKVQTSGKEAVKFPIRIKTLDLGTHDVAIVTVDTLDMDLKPANQIKFSLQDGLSRNPDAYLNNNRITEMYVRGYTDGLEVSPNEVYISEELRELELAGR